MSDKTIQTRRRGALKFQIGDTEPFFVDAALFWNECVKRAQAYEDGSGELLNDYIDLLVKAGAPKDITGVEADAVANAISEFLTLEKKTAKSAASSPSPTDSTASESTPTSGG